MTHTGHDCLKVRKTLTVGGQSYDYFSLPEAANKLGNIDRLPFTLKILLENLLRFEDDRSVTVEDAKALVDWQKEKKSTREIAYRPARVLLQDFTGVPAVVDLAAMREAIVSLGGNAQKINPLSAVDLVIDHSVMVDEFGTEQAFKHNVEREFERNKERYEFLRWGQDAFKNFRVVPPGTGICHQVNLEYLGQTVWMEEDQNGKKVAYPDTLVGTDSHTTMINGLAVLGWGVGGIEAEAAMLGQPVSMLIPEVIGFKLTGKLKEGATATDLVLTVTQMLRAKGVVGKFVEFYGPGLDHMSLADRATISNMAPEYGATCGFFPIDKETIRYLKFTGRDDSRVKLVEAYAKEQGMWRDESSADPVFTDTLELDMGTVEPSMAGPKRPQDKILLSGAAKSFTDLQPQLRSVAVEGAGYEMTDGNVAIAAITSCTNTSNPSVMVAAGLLARNAVKKGLKTKPWVKTSLAPGSQVVTDYLEKAGLQNDLDQLGFDLVGYGCTTCIGNSGPLPGPIAAAIEKGDLNVCGVLSGNRNFEGRISPHVKSNYLASPPLVVAYALAGSLTVDLYNDPIGQDKDGRDVYLKDIWPSNKDIADTVASCLTPEMFRSRYSNVFLGTEEWQAIAGDESGQTYRWDTSSTYVKNPPFFDRMGMQPDSLGDIKGARCLALMGDSVTTDHISPAGSIKSDSPAGSYLKSHNVSARDFNSYGSRRGNHEVMMRGTFANIRIKNEMLENVEGGYTKYIPTGEQMSIYDAAMKYEADGTPLVVIAGKEYGTGSSRDWAAKGTRLLGVKAVITESFERIHRSNLIGMGILPLQFKDGKTRKTLKLNGTETFDISGINSLSPQGAITLTITRTDGSTEKVELLVRIDTLDELDYYKNGGILHYVLRRLAA
ncbi:MAG: aconitate hydratase AcnA [Rhodospirillales bacterium]|nr:aconitate hydratase AcnA [Rhodospirillales bacterium]MCB9965430.1 aconitate hydratase AcnA [Rhodospirillales bacterium]MCB9973927.1 aconitate hydratase AcnA [Rhodospirillales bacterium]MCB9979865.1 aconitate hydratase AcnA [Rhodospirillales bacterium]